MSIVTPEQVRTVDPYSEERFTSTLNRFTRIFTGGLDYLLLEETSFKFTTANDATSDTFVAFTDGLAIKDDVLLHMTQDGGDNGVDFAVDEYYLDEIPGMITNGWYYIVLYYNYDRSYPPPKAYYRILRDTSIFQTYQSNYLFLAAVYVENGVLIQKKYYDPTDPDVGKRIWLRIYWISNECNILLTEANENITTEDDINILYI